MSNNTRIDDMVKGYYKWLYDNTIIKRDGLTEWYSIDTPFIGLANDRIEVFVKKDGDKFILSDDGETLWGLKMKGIDISHSASRRNILKGIELNFAVRIENGEIVTEATKENFFSRKHAILQAIQQVSDLRMTAKKDIVSMFSEDLKQYLDANDVVYTPQFTLIGKSGLNFYYDFQIAGKMDETVIRTFNQLKQGNVTDILFGIEDVRSNRESMTGKSLQSIVVVNDSERPPRREYVSALNEYGCKTLFWSKKDIDWNAKSLIPA